MSDLNAAIREHLNHRPVRHVDPQLESAVQAVLDQCEQMRTMRVGPDNEPVGRDIAAEFEQAIARALGVTS